MSNTRYIRRVGVCTAVLAALGLAACKSDSSTTSATSVAQTVVVVGVDTPESHVLTEVYAQALEHAGFRVARRDDVADLAAGYQALQSGAADLFITHTADLLAYTSTHEPAANSTSTTAAPTTTEAPTTTIDTNTTAPNTTTTLEVGPVAPTSTSGSTATNDTTETTVEESTTTTISIVGQAAAESINGQTKLIGEILPTTLQIGAASDAENKSVIACNGGVATTGSLSTLSDLGRAADVLTIAGPKEFETATSFGLPGFEKTYGGTFKKFIPVDAAKIGDEITSPTTVPASTTTGANTTTTAVDATTTTIADLPSDADCAAMNSLDITMPSNAVVMDDNLNWVEANGVIPLVSATGYTPGVSQLLDKVSQALKTNDLRTMLIRVVTNKVTPAAMASQYITAAGLAGS
ncbi:MAG: Substrate-binding region of ABC-type glycine betaine transport system [Ilumatobacteraceae bacterium]|nr:Substrate-binding region of ABC-type glycine betaine transport system [Ilumatobacteraceae bacterium]MCU1390962.1 Substrate-binding region of ABC-type glycine betaine transport system [Ilumatobacteraceae bacterium]